MTSCLGKICERVVVDRLTNWSERKTLIHESQNGFRKGRGTMDNLASMNSIIRRNSRSNKETVIMLVDVKAAYDNVDHSILLNILTKIKCPERIYNYIKKWLKQRKNTFIREFEPDRIEDSFIGLPQGSILSPILYNIYTLELGHRMEEENYEILQYADDIAIIITCNNMKEAERNTTNAMQTLTEKLKEIQLEISESKTQILYYTKHTRRSNKLKIKRGEILIEESERAKFLGITLHNKLKFNHQVEETEKK